MLWVTQMPRTTVEGRIDKAAVLHFLEWVRGPRQGLRLRLGHICTVAEDTPRDHGGIDMTPL